MPPKSGFRKRIILLLVTAFLIFSVLVSAIDIVYTIRNIKSESEDKLMNHVLVQAGELDMEINKRAFLGDIMSRYVKASFSLEALNSEPGYLDEYEKLLEIYMVSLAEEYQTVWLFFNPELDNSTHDVWYHDSDGDGTVERMPEIDDISYYDDESGKDWFFKPKRDKIPRWSAPYSSTVLDEPVIWISYSHPVFIDGLFIGVSGSDFYFTELSEQIGNLSIYGSGYAFLLDESFNMLIHPDQENASESYRWLESLTNNEDSGILEYQGADKSTAVLAYARLANDWIICIKAPWQEIYRTLWTKIYMTIAFVSTGILLTVLIIFILTRNLTRGLESLTSIISALGAGDYDTPIPESYMKDMTEIGTMAGAVEGMRLQQQKSFAEINLINENLEVQVEQRTAELMKTQEKLVETRRYEAVNRFIVEIAHRLNTPLGNARVAVTFMEDVIEKLSVSNCNSDDADFKGHIESLQETIKLANSGIYKSSIIIRNLKSLSEDSSMYEAVTIGVYDLTEAGSLEFQSRLSAETDIKFGINCPPELVIYTYPKLLLEAFYTLMNHLVFQSMSGVDDKWIDIEITEAGGDKGQIEFRFGDNSRFLFSETAKRIFEPYSLNPMESGPAGLEMYRLYTIVKIGLSGNIEYLEGEDGKPCFVIRLDKAPLAIQQPI